MGTLGNSLSMLKDPAIIKFIMQGVLFTLIISVVAVLLSIVIGTMLALMRNYCTGKKTGILKVLSVIYIEMFRNTPLLFWIFICVVFCPIPKIMDRPMFGLSSVNNKLLFKAAVALILYTSGVIAEIVRGGLNSVQRGQIEAGQSQGFNMLQILSAANRYNGTGAINVSDVFVLFGVAAMIYFVINFSLSMTVRSIKEKKGVHRRILGRKKISSWNGTCEYAG